VQGRRRISLFYAGALDEVKADVESFLAELNRRGHVRDANIVVDLVFADGDRTRLSRLAEDLVRNRPDVIVAFGQYAPTAAARASATIPIVFVENGWPLERGLIDSYARPGRNATGNAISAGFEATTKRLDFLRQIAPSAKRLSCTLTLNYLSPDTVSGKQNNLIPALTAAAKERGFDSRFHEVRDWQDMDALFKQVTETSAQALMSFPLPSSAVRRYIDLAIQNRLPTAFYDRGFATDGGLLSYGRSDAEALANPLRAAEYVDRILRGAKPADLPVYTPSRYELVINLKTAKAIGLTIPQSLLLRADEVIQ
jgi:putative ABC transport system substrate-binding protein